MTKTNIPNVTNNNQVPNGGYSLANTAISGGVGLTYTTGSTNWSTAIVDSYYTKKPKVSITDLDIEIDGLSLKETMLAVKNELMIPTRINRNDELEREFAELKEYADRYQELERKFLEQKKMWETLKK